MFFIIIYGNIQLNEWKYSMNGDTVDPCEYTLCLISNDSVIWNGEINTLNINNMELGFDVHCVDVIRLDDYIEIRYRFNQGIWIDVKQETLESTNGPLPLYNITQSNETNLEISIQCILCQNNETKLCLNKTHLILSEYKTYIFLYMYVIIVK